MIRVTVELFSANTGARKILGVMDIINRGDHPDTPKRGNYEVRVRRKGNSTALARTGAVEDFPRLSYNVWRLVSRALRSAFPEEG